MGGVLRKSKKNNSETFSLIWLDAKVNNSQENINAQHQLRKLINQLKTYTDSDQCEQYIRSVSDNHQIILIVSGHLGQIVVPRIHQLRQISSIYIYCMDKTKNEQWSNQFEKVKYVIVQLDELIAYVQMDQNKRIDNKRNESLAFSIFNTAAVVQEQSTIEVNGQFLHSQLLIDCLIRMKSTSTDKNELVSLCKIQYKRNKTELKNIHEFDQDYSADDALKWYTKPSFLYRELNKALRTQNIDLLFLFRFFIRDLGRQLKQYQCILPVRIYRGQLMSNDELKFLRDAVGQFISINSFFSTTVNRDIALLFLGDPTIIDSLQRVLFEIDADPHLDGIKPFANISLVSYFPDEEEILMMIGSVFRLIAIHYEDNHIWIVRMRLCSDNDYDLKQISDHMKNEFFAAEETNLGQFGNVLRCMGKLDDAEKYYCRLLKELPYDHQDITGCYWGLGIVAFNKGQHDTSLEWYRKALKTFQQTLQSDHRHLADIQNCIGSAYEGKGKFKQALKSYEEAVMIYQRTLGEDHHHIAMCFGNMGNIYQKEQKYSKALDCHQKALFIWQKSLPPDHHYLGSTHNNIANVYSSLRRYDLTLHHYNQALAIKSRSLPGQHPSIGSTLKNISDVYENMGQLQKALAFLKQAAEIYDHSLPATHPYVVDIKKDIQRVSCRIRQSNLTFSCS